MSRREDYVEDNRTLHSYSLKGKMFVHIPHRERYCTVTAEVCEFSQMEDLCIESEVSEEDPAGMQQHHSCSHSPQLLLVNCCFNIMNTFFVDFITICLWDNTAQVLLCDSSFVQPPTLGVPPGPCRYHLWSWLCSCLLCRSPLGLFYSFTF